MYIYVDEYWQMPEQVPEKRSVNIIQVMYKIVHTPFSVANEGNI